MTKKIFRSIFLATLVVFVASLALTLTGVYWYFNTVQQTQLREQSAMVARGVDQGGAAYLEGLSLSDYRITWMDASGDVLYDNAADAASMENHGDREEVQAAFRSGYGESSRYSATLSQKTFYSARLLSDGTVVRVSVAHDAPWLLLLNMSHLLLLVLAVAVFLSAWLSARLAKRIVEPLNNVDVEHPLENQVYDELAPLLTRLASQHGQIRTQMEELQRKQDEFSAITSSMREGLVLLNDKGHLLHINPSAARLFGTDASCLGRDFLTVERSLPMQALVDQALHGVSGEACLERAGRCYQIDASPAPSGGVVLLAVDVTEKSRAEQLRREFTANVSHELKTPLQSIMGSAELLRNKLVQPADEDRFLQRIYDEASRLVTLIGDIIRLSQLDENASALPWTQIDLYSLASEVVGRLQDQAEQAHVRLTLHGDRAPLFTVAQLVEEILYNLTENAIKYNQEQGTVDVIVEPGPGGVLLVVEDTGVGIPAQHQSRVFERFYRVDQSHSKATGGTGLGLSIVKHAAQYLGADLELTSEEGQGTRVTLHFPAARRA